jgi:Transposase DDE domain
VERRDIPANSAVISDSVIRYNALRSQQKQLPDARQVVYVDTETKKQYTFITNHFKLSAQTIADIYKQRWQVELFFNPVLGDVEGRIKQDLKISPSSALARMR